jgi:hypothetical protein
MRVGISGTHGTGKTTLAQALCAGIRTRLVSAARRVSAGFPDGLSLLVAHSRLRCGGVTFRACLIVRPIACVRACTCRPAREGRDGTTCGTITHGDGSSAARARQRPRLTWTARPASACSRRCR